MNEKIICKVGQYDIPIVQMQPVFEVDLLKSNIAIFGSAMSGKTTCLKQLINQLHVHMDETSEQIFILDFSGALREYKDMPLVAAYFDNSNEEYVKRVFKILENILKDNVKKLGSFNYSSAGDAQPIHTTFIIDNLNSFIDENRYSNYHDKFGRICREGRSRGVSVVFTASDTKGVSRYLLSFEQKIAFNLPVDKNMEIFGEKAEPIGNIAGRGYANVTERPGRILGTFSMNSPYEFQAYMAREMRSTTALQQKYGLIPEHGVEPYEKHVKRYMTFPEELRIEDYEKLKQPYEEGDKIPSEDAIAVGLDYVEFKPVTVDIDRSRVIGIYGKKEFGKTNLLSFLMKELVRQKPEADFVFFDDGRKELRRFYDQYKDQMAGCIMIDEYQDVEIPLFAQNPILKKLSPIQQFYRYIHENVYCLGDAYGGYADMLYSIYGEDSFGSYAGQVSDSDTERGQWGILPGLSRPTVFIIQSKAIYTNSKMNSAFLHYLLPEMLDLAEEKDYIFLFTDIKKITEPEINSLFNGMLKTVFLLDNIAEFASEKGSRTVFGEMDAKSLKEEYAKCELGDGYAYDVEADRLKKMKFLFNPDM